MSNEKELIKKMSDYLIGILELNIIQREKEQCVKDQDYENACHIREREKEVMKKLPTLEEMKDLRKLLD